jgi:Fur family ferric uptake transcriptional regulator
MTDNSNSPSAADEIRSQIRTAGLRSTAARVAVMQQLQGATSPLSHAELADRLVPEGFDRATVYRNLIDLAEAGLVSRSELGDHVWRYELMRPGHGHNTEHPHFVCIDCGEVTCLPEGSVAISPSPGAEHSVIGQLTEILLKGRCERCS